MPPFLIALLAALAAIGAGLPLIALPATLSLPRGIRPGLEPLTLDQAAERLRATGLSGMALVEAARALTAGRMVYCRRNSFDLAPRAFERGYGYCQQQAFALSGLLTRLGVEARPVQALRNRFPNGAVGGHAWVRVRLDGRQQDIDTLYYDPATQRLGFTSLTPVTGYSPLFRLLAGWGSTAVNAIRYYRTGKDH